MAGRPNKTHNRLQAGTHVRRAACFSFTCCTPTDWYHQPAHSLDSDSKVSLSLARSLGAQSREFLEQNTRSKSSSRRWYYRPPRKYIGDFEAPYNQICMLFPRTWRRDWWHTHERGDPALATWTLDIVEFIATCRSMQCFPPCAQFHPDNPENMKR